MTNPEIVEAAFEQMGPVVFAPCPVLRMRIESEGGIVFVTYPRGGRSVLRHTLNQTAGAIYRLLDGRRSVADVIGIFSAKFPEIPLPDLAWDILILMRTLERKGIIEEARAGERAKVDAEE